MEDHMEVSCLQGSFGVAEFGAAIWGTVIFHGHCFQDIYQL